MFGDRLHTLRVDHGYSMDYLAEIYNKKYNGRLNKSTISRYENGLQEPMLFVVNNLADLFSVSVDYLTGKEKSTPVSESGPSETIMQIIDVVRQLTPETQERCLEYFESLLALQNSAQVPNLQSSAEKEP